MSKINTRKMAPSINEMVLKILTVYIKTHNLGEITGSEYYAITCTNIIRIKYLNRDIDCFLRSVAVSRLDIYMNTTDKEFNDKLSMMFNVLNHFNYDLSELKRIYNMDTEELELYLRLS